jgi:hypothetical protein
VADPDMDIYAALHCISVEPWASTLVDSQVAEWFQVWPWIITCVGRVQCNHEVKIRYHTIKDEARLAPSA